MSKVFMLVNFKNHVPSYVRKIAEELDAYICTAGNVPAVARDMYDILINWGVGRPTKWDTGHMININSWHAVKTSVDKDHTLLTLHKAGLTVPEFTRDYRVAKGWVDDGAKVYARTLRDSYDGHDIKIISLDIDCINELPMCPFYTRKVETNLEFRVHVMDGKVIDYLQKKRRIGKDINYDMRTTEGGWIHARKDIIDITEVRHQAVLAAAAVGLDFCGVDIGVNYDFKNKVVNEITVFETNTAPELEPTTTENYISAFTKLIKKHTKKTEQHKQMFSGVTITESNTAKETKPKKKVKKCPTINYSALYGIASPQSEDTVLKAPVPDEYVQEWIEPIADDDDEDYLI